MQASEVSNSKKKKIPNSKKNKIRYKYRRIKPYEIKLCSWQTNFLKINITKSGSRLDC